MQGAAPTREVATLLPLGRVALQALPPPGPMRRAVVLCKPAALRPVQLDLRAPAGPAPERLATTLARTQALCGEGRVGAPAPPDTHLPGVPQLVSFLERPGRPQKVAARQQARLRWSAALASRGPAQAPQASPPGRPGLKAPPAALLPSEEGDASSPGRQAADEPGMMDTAVSSDPLLPLLQQLTALQSSLPFQPLRTTERRELGGHLFPNAPALVQAVGVALRDRPDLFPDVPLDGAALLAAQRQALHWLFLRDCLRAMAEQAADAYLKVQGEAVRQALAIVRYVKDQAPPFSAADRTGQRNLQLVPAYLIVHAHHESLKKRKAQKTQRRQGRLGPPPAAPAPSPARQRAAEAERAGHRAAFRDLFQARLDEERALPPPPAAPPGPPG